MVENLEKKPKKVQLTKKTIFIIVIVVFILTAIVVALFLVSRVKTENNNVNKEVVKADIPYVPQTQPIGSPNAGSVYGDTLKSQIEKATKDAEVLAAEIAKIPSPQSTEDKIALSKKRLELGKLYINAMLHKEAIETLDKVEFIDVNDYSEARALMGKAAVATGNTELAKRFYNQAISALKPVPANDEKINQYKAELALLG